MLGYLDRYGLSMLIIKRNKIIFSTAQPGAGPLIELVERFGPKLSRATVVDRVVGTCAGIIFCYLGVARVIARTMSAGGLQKLSECKIRCYYQELVSEIRNRDRTGICPFEKMAKRYPEPESLISALRSIIKGAGKTRPAKVR